MLKLVSEVVGLALIALGLALLFGAAVAMVFLGTVLVAAVEVHS